MNTAKKPANVRITSAEKMTPHQINLTEAEHAMFDQVRRERKLATIEDAIEWLVRARLRRTSEHASGIRRGPRLVSTRGQHS